MTKSLRILVALVIAAAAGVAVPAQSPAVTRRSYPEGFITGRVLNGGQPEAGVWVIAETKETNTPFIKIVVTDDQGRFTLPQLPDATYNVWVRGYGLLDSAKVEGPPRRHRPRAQGRVREDSAGSRQGLSRRLLAVVAGSSRGQQLSRYRRQGAAAATAYAPAIVSQDDWMHRFKKDCNFCHQLGNQLTRTLTHMDFTQAGLQVA